MLINAFITAQANVMQTISALTAVTAASQTAKAKHSVLPFARANNKQMDLKNGAY